MNGFFLTDVGAIGDQFLVSGGCDNDDSFDSGEVVTYSVALLNRSRNEDFGDVVATLTPTGPGQAALRVLDSPMNIGRLPGSGFNGASFHVFVDKAIADALPLANRKVTMVLTLDSLNRGIRLARQSYSFLHAINSDRQVLHYSTDAPTGGRQVRDLNRNLIIDPPDVIDPFLGYILPDEDITFTSMFQRFDGGTVVTNALGEDINGNGSLTGDTDLGEDAQPNGVIDKGILLTTNPADTQRVPWNFDNNDGGWIAFRHPSSTPANITGNVLWEYKTQFGNCGFQTQGCLTGGKTCAAQPAITCTVNSDCGAGDTCVCNKFGIWHTGDGNPATPGTVQAACDNYAQPSDPQTPPQADLIFDVLESPVIAKVNQQNDARGFPFTVEFQRFAGNFNTQTIAIYNGLGINIDNDANNDTGDCLLCQDLDSYYTRRNGGWPYTVFRLQRGSFPYGGLYPGSFYMHRRTFGNFLNPNGSNTFDGDEEGFTANTQNTNPYSATPITVTTAKFTPFPRDPATDRAIAGLCDGGTNDKNFCKRTCSNNIARACLSNADCVAPGTCGENDPLFSCPGGACRVSDNTVAGPVRNFESSLIGYEGAFATVVNGTGTNENFFFWTPGKDANRWQIGLGFFSMEANPVATDYGFGVDDVVFEWDERHPLDETAAPPNGLGKRAACDRFQSTGGTLAGGQCATITVDRTDLWECEESMVVTVVDPKPNSATSVQVMVTTESDSVEVSTLKFAARHPNTKRYTLDRIATNPATYRGTITVSNVANNPTNVFTTPGKDGQFIVYYVDPLCDGDGDGVVGEVEFGNIDGDGIPARGCSNAQTTACTTDAQCPGGTCIKLDDCPFAYNPASAPLPGGTCPVKDPITQQCDTDGDGAGDICDNCVTVSNSDQIDTNADGVGDRCEFDDVDGDGKSNEEDNCPDLYNPGDPAGAGGSGRGTLCSGNGDLDGDGVADRLDNCVLAYNPNQENTDADQGIVTFGLGDACDGDCQNVTLARICSNQPSRTCVTTADCVQPGFCQDAARHPIGSSCSASDDDGDGDSIVDSVDNCPDVYNPPLFTGSETQADKDRDGQGDACDDPGSEDDDFNGIPDDIVNFIGTIDCKVLPLASLSVVKTDYRDTNGDHDRFPDTGEVGRLAVTIQNRGARPQDKLTGLSMVLTSTDPNVACITNPAITVGDLLPGQILKVGDEIDTTKPAFVFVAKDTLQTVKSTDPARLSFCLAVTANESLGTKSPLCFSLIADLDQPAGSQSFVLGPDGRPNTQDDGLLVENFDVDKNLDTNFTVRDTFWSPTGVDASNNPIYGGTCDSEPLKSCTRDTDCARAVCTTGGSIGTACDPAANACAGPGTCSNDGSRACTVNGDCVAPGVCRGVCKVFGLTSGTCQSGTYLYGSKQGTASNTVAGVACAGYPDEAAGNAACILDTDYPMDWHFHCPPNATHCPNLESGQLNSSTCVGSPACSYKTPAGGVGFQKALSCQNKAAGQCNSLHMGAHFDLTNNLLGDTTHLRALQGFVTSPINLTLLPRGDHDDLKMSFYQITRLMDEDGVNIKHQCADCADVQIRVDQNTDARVDEWGFWDKLVPFENVYDHQPIAFSVFKSYYCIFTPTDTGTAPPAPRVPPVHETMCYGEGAWSSCGTVRGTKRDSVAHCDGPGLVDPAGIGVWVRTSFDLSNYVGQRVQIRWIGASWVFDASTSTYFEYGAGWSDTTADDGWWIDDINVSGVVTTSTPPPPDNRPSAGGVCPTLACDPAVVSPDHGTAPSIKATDLTGAVFDGVSRVASAGQQIRITAIDSTIPGGCIGGAPQYRFLKNGAVVQDWSSKAYFQDAPEVSASYTAFVRCSSSFTCQGGTRNGQTCALNSDCPGGTCADACTSLTGASIDVPIYSGEGAESLFIDKNVAGPFTQAQISRGVTYTGTPSPTTTLKLWAPGGPNSLDVYKGQIGGGASIGTFGPGAQWKLNSTIVQCDLTGSLAPGSGSNYIMNLTAAQDPNPGPGTATYYVAAVNTQAGGTLASVGCSNPGKCLGGTRNTLFCTLDGDCPGGTCLNSSAAGVVMLPNGCPVNGDAHKANRAPAATCP